MSIKEDAHKIIDNLPEGSGWNDLVLQLYKEKKITLGMTDIELAQSELSETDLSSIMYRLESSSSIPDDMRNTKTYTIDNTLTASWIMVAFAPILFISILLAPVAYILSTIGVFIGIKALVNKQKTAWLPILVGIIELILFVVIPLIGTGR